MTARSPDRDDLLASIAMRGLVEAHQSGRLSTELYRQRRRRLLEAVTRGGAVPKQLLPAQENAARMRIAWLAAVLLVLFVFGWWLFG